MFKLYAKIEDNIDNILKLQKKVVLKQSRKKIWEISYFIY